MPCTGVLPDGTAIAPGKLDFKFIALETARYLLSDSTAVGF
jgi:hypothetical protein